MKRFTLAGLLRVRDLQQQQAAAELADANHALEAARARRSRTRAVLAGTPADAVDSATLSAIVAARATSHVLLGELATLHDRVAAEAGDARSAHTAARVNSLSLEKLHARHVEAETTRELHAEQAALDEIAIQGWRTAREGNA